MSGAEFGSASVILVRVLGALTSREVSISPGICLVKSLETYRRSTIGLRSGPRLSIRTALERLPRRSKPPVGSL